MKLTATTVDVRLNRLRGLAGGMTVQTIDPDAGEAVSFNHDPSHSHFIKDCALLKSKLVGVEDSDAPAVFERLRPDLESPMKDLAAEKVASVLARRS